MKTEKTTKKSTTIIRLNYPDGRYEDMEIDTKMWNAACRLAKKSHVSIDAWLNDALLRMMDRVKSGKVQLPAA